MALRPPGNLQLHAAVMTLGGGARSEKYLGIKWAGSRRGEVGKETKGGRASNYWCCAGLPACLAAGS